MVLIRCLDHPPDEQLYQWEVAIEPAGYPDTAVICGYRTHGEAVPGFAWLTEWEYEQYTRGRRVFSLSGSSTQIRLTDTVRKGQEVMLSRPSEPSASDLDAVETPASSTDTTHTSAESRSLTEAVQLYLWSEYWEETLTASGLTWETFVSQTTAEKPVVEEWADGARTWNELLERYAKAISANLEES